MTDRISMSFISTFTKLKPADVGPDRRDIRSVGFLADKDKAIKAVESNAGDINEAGFYPLALVETLNEGIYPKTVSTVWFEWDEEAQGYRKISKRPKDLQSVCNFSLG